MEKLKDQTNVVAAKLSPLSFTQLGKVLVECPYCARCRDVDPGRQMQQR
jgi:hypothetical protein